jgi:hypothetical protein
MSVGCAEAVGWLRARVIAWVGKSIAEACAFTCLPFRSWTTVVSAVAIVPLVWAAMGWQTVGRYTMNVGFARVLEFLMVHAIVLVMSTTVQEYVVERLHWTVLASVVAKLCAPSLSLSPSPSGATAWPSAMLWRMCAASVLAMEPAVLAVMVWRTVVWCWMYAMYVAVVGLLHRRVTVQATLMIVQACVEARLWLTSALYVVDQALLQASATVLAM